MPLKLFCRFPILELKFGLELKFNKLELNKLVFQKQRNL